MRIFKVAIIGAFLFLAACEKPDPIIPNEEEVITSLYYTLIPIGGGDEITFSFIDFDGDGGNEPMIIGGTLKAETSYCGKLELLNEQDVPVSSITEEIIAEAADHQFFFILSFPGLTIEYDDQDSNNNPVGLITKLTTTGASEGTIKIILRHEPDKNASGVKEGEISNAGGETDIEVSFTIDVK